MVFLKYINSKETISCSSLEQILLPYFETIRKHKRVLIIPPDISRVHSRAGEITCLTVKHLPNTHIDILPALGTHKAMSAEELNTMFPGVNHNLFKIHNWKDDLELLGKVPAELIEKASNNSLHMEWPLQLNKRLIHGNYDLILSIGQVVPHEVMGMSNYNKNIFIGTGGLDSINLSHYISAVYGMEKILGKASNPVRDILEYASDNFTNTLPIHYILTVLGSSPSSGLHGVFAGDDKECFYNASELSAELNIITMAKPFKKVIVYLDPKSYKSTWLGNKAIYRTRQAIADGGELIIIAPGLERFGEDPEIDRIIRKFGYRKKEEIISLVNNNSDLADNLAAAAHLIHGSSEDRFTVTYCTNLLSKSKIQEAGYKYDKISNYFNISDEIFQENTYIEEDVYFIKNPALAMWNI